MLLQLYIKYVGQYAQEGLQFVGTRNPSPPRRLIGASKKEPHQQASAPTMCPPVLDIFPISSANPAEREGKNRNRGKDLSSCKPKLCSGHEQGVAHRNKYLKPALFASSRWAMTSMSQCRAHWSVPC